LLIPPEFPGIPIRSCILLDSKERNRGFRSPERKKEREGRFRQLSNHTKLSTGLLGPRGWGTKQSNTPSAGGSRIRKELKPADGAGEYAPTNPSLVDTVKVVDMGEPKLSWPDWNPGHRSSISPRPPPPGDLNLIEYPVQAGRQQPLPHPGIPERAVG
ncbi:hypothetical protein THAOC_29107, partial [Thalassiosira oceanica]